MAYSKKMIQDLYFKAYANQEFAVPENFKNKQDRDVTPFPIRGERLIERGKLIGVTIYHLQNKKGGKVREIPETIYFK